MMKVLKFHAQRKAILEIGYYDEEGTGLGPTLEFYSLVTAEFRRKALKMWICEDDEQINGQQIDLGEGVKPPGYYVQRIGGLFPAYLPPDSDECRDVTMLFETFGIFIAKLIQGWLLTILYC
jgi:E3 ubiquitin-protein ligase HECTD1